MTCKRLKQGRGDWCKWLGRKGDGGPELLYISIDGKYKKERTKRDKIYEEGEKFKSSEGKWDARIHRGKTEGNSNKMELMKRHRN